MKKKKYRKNCPECLYQIPKSGACQKNPERQTYSIWTLPTDSKDREWCPDMKKRRK
jgi:hypothetical protein